MTLPNFLIVGAAKSGTSSLWLYLKQHPQIFMATTKEPNFFAFEGKKLPPESGAADCQTLYNLLYRYSIVDILPYQNLFKNCQQAKAIGEASVRYLYSTEAAANIKKYLPDVKMIAILRNPVDRLYSHYLMMKHYYQLEPLSLLEAIEQEQARINNNWGWDWHYVQIGMYAQQINQYLQLFAPEQIKIILYDDFCQNPAKVYQDICRYLEVNCTFLPDFNQKLKQGYWSNKSSLGRWLYNSTTFSQLRSNLKQILPNLVYESANNYLQKVYGISKPSMSATTRQYLQSIFQEDIIELQDYLGYHLPW